MIPPIPGAPAAPIPLFIDSLNQAIDQATLAQQCFADLSALFRAIARLSDTYTSAHELATLGNTLAQDWANLCDVEREELEMRCGELWGAVGPGKWMG
ncbi:hypothetical protein [Chitiniphilus eburneus]|uniref:Uncharacterized protein n=1 Tax=Chitiniphilus eburneus TaxID=2571148 RepID=A0A4V5MNV9_9NEIS|nr:hypothetical protein [Chitiniphilus eburneus]TJZ66388.1 hypothetical protein FAZ21_17340 [Chitiniphilus eburneus]